MLPINIIINVILSLQTGFLTFSRKIQIWISNPNSQEKEYGFSCESRVLKKEQAIVAGLSPLGGKDSSQKAGGARESPESTIIKEGRHFLPKSSLENLCSPSLTVYTICAKGQTWLLMCREESDPLGRRVTQGWKEGNQYSLSTCYALGARLGPVYTQSEVIPVTVFACFGLNCVPPEFICWSPDPPIWLSLVIRTLWR